uniref:RNA-dependent RNA polymerase n=1 Tax=Hanseniella sp. mitovirus TaxID=2964777 RepID=A0A9N6YJC1_9VIRU|nr:TPA_inf: RNA-dependent RNA polymerase [Hanseniella sp. mitovirus]
MTGVHLYVSWSLFVLWHLRVQVNTWTHRRDSNQEISPRPVRKIRAEDLEVLRKVYDFSRHLAGKGASVGILRGIYLAQARKLKKQDPRIAALQLKEDYLLIKNYFLMGKVVGVSQTPVWRKANRDGVPPYLSPIINLSLRWLEKVLLLTLLRTYKSMTTDSATYSLDSVSKPMSVRQYLTTIGVASRALDWKEIGLPEFRKKDLRWRDLTSSNYNLETVSLISARGPSGRNPFSRVLDLLHLIRSPFRLWLVLQLERTISHSIQGVVGKIAEWMEDPSFSSPQYLPLLPFIVGAKLKRLYYQVVTDSLSSLHRRSYEKRVLNRLTYFTDGLGKYRYIAMADWPTQSILRSLHSMIIKRLRLMENDATYDQGKIYDWYQRNIGLPLYSLDLRSATDRLPLVLQRVLISFFFRRKLLGLLWILLITTSKFHIKGKFPIEYVNYGAGQGIGIYSSWAMLALTNHYVVRLAGRNCGYERFRDYLVLGDDIVIANTQVAREYQSLINRIGVEISIPKSVIRSESYKSLEFASKLLCNGQDISPFPVGLIKESTSDRQSLLTLWSQLVGRCLYSSPQDVECMTTPDLGPTFPLSGKEDVRATWGLYFSYVNFYIDWKKSQVGGRSGGLLAKLPFEHPLHTLWEATPLSVYMELEMKVRSITERKLIRALRLVLKYEGNTAVELIYSMLSSYLRTDRGEQGSTPSRDLWWIASFLARPWFHGFQGAVSLLSQVSGVRSGLPLSGGGGVILVDDREFISDYLQLINKGPGIRFLNLKEEEILNFIRLSLGPKAVYLDVDNQWMGKAGIKVVKAKTQRISKNTAIQGLRKSFLIAAMNKVYKQRLSKRASR